MKRVNLLLVLLALVSVANAGMFFDAGSDKSGYSDTPGSISDATGSGATEFWYYDNSGGKVGADLSLNADSYTVSTQISNTWDCNAYSRVFFDGVNDPATHHQVADLGFNIHDPSVAYSVTWRVKLENALIGNPSRSVFSMYWREGVGEDSGQGFKQGIASIAIKADNPGMADNATNPLKLYNTVFTMGEWHDITLTLDATTGVARSRKVLLDGAEVANITWANYWNYNGAEAMMSFGQQNPDTSVDYSIDYVEVVPEPATLAILGLGGLLLRRRRA